MQRNHRKSWIVDLRFQAERTGSTNLQWQEPGTVGEPKHEVTRERVMRRIPPGKLRGGQRGKKQLRSSVDP